MRDFTSSCADDSQHAGGLAVRITLDDAARRIGVPVDAGEAQR
ncbi:MAG: hypothetical protein U1F35_03410 [Steroidobacteraceae bacterium]